MSPIGLGLASQFALTAAAEPVIFGGGSVGVKLIG